jgi:endonuclease/exonuclease/phosphatase family metal-dependent hydrolase
MANFAGNGIDSIACFFGLNCNQKSPKPAVLSPQIAESRAKCFYFGTFYAKISLQHGPFGFEFKDVPVRKLIFAGLVVLAFKFVLFSNAAIILSDSFDYSNGSIVTNSGSVWITHSGVTGQVQVVSSRVLLSQTNTEDVSAQLRGQPYSASTNVLLYARFTINFATHPSGAGTYFAHFKDATASGFRDKIFATTNGAPTGFFRVGVGNVTNSNFAVMNLNLSLNTDYVVVTRYALSNATSTLWLNPSDEADPGLAATDTAGTLTITSFGLRQSLSGGDGMGTLFFDELRVGTSFRDVVPPSAPFITVEPQSQMVIEGSNVTFSVTAIGAQPLSYQWMFNGTNVDSATSSSLTLVAVTTNDAGPYSVTITNAFGFTNSDVATLTVVPFSEPPTITGEPQSQIVSAGENVAFTVEAMGDAPLTYQWRFNGGVIAGATNSTFSLFSVTTNRAGTYVVTVSNNGGSTNSLPAMLTVNAVAQQFPALSYVIYNMEGNGATNWTTNSLQVRAIARELQFLNPDIITLNEIPNQFTYEMTNFIAAFLPGYYLADNSATDGFIRSGIASRFPIIGSKSYLHSSDLNQWGYTNSNFTRDLFEAQIAVPNFPQPLHVFVVHLKSAQDTDSSAKRAAEASAISNFFATVFLPTNTSFHPYVLSGDMNEDINRPPSSHPHSIERLVNPATGLQLTTPVNPISGSDLTHSIQAVSGLNKRYDYIMPCGLLLSNIVSSQVFRTDLLTNPPPTPPLQTNDDVVASDHLPVFMVFGNPYDKAFRLTSVAENSATLSVTWESVPGQMYRLEASPNLADWTVLANNLMATDFIFTFATNSSDDVKFVRVHKGL